METKEVRPNWALLGAWLVFAFCFTWGMFHMPWVANNYSRLDMGDPVDSATIVRSLSHSPRIADVINWWVGPWVDAPTAVYYRPIPSTLWWVMYYSPLRSITGFMVVLWISHLTFAVTAVHLFKRLVGFRVAIVGVSLWVSGAADVLTLSSPSGAMGQWKNLVEPWVWTLVAFTLLLLIHWKKVGKFRWGITTALMAFAACLTKEMAYTLPLLGALVLWKINAPLRDYRKLWGVMAGPICAFILRCVALHGEGNKPFTSGSWFPKMLSSIGGGRASIVVYGGDLVPLALALFVLALIVIPWKGLASWKLSLGLVVLGCCAVQVTEYLSPGGFPGDSWLRLIPLTTLDKAVVLRDAAITGALGALAAFFISSRNQQQLFAWLWVISSYLPLTLSTVWPHGLYGPSLGWGLFLAVPCICLADWLLAHWPRIMPVIAGSRFEVTS